MWWCGLAFGFRCFEPSFACSVVYRAFLSRVCAFWWHGEDVLQWTEVDVSLS